MVHRLSVVSVAALLALAALGTVLIYSHSFGTAVAQGPQPQGQQVQQPAAGVNGTSGSLLTGTPPGASGGGSDDGGSLDP